MYAMSVDDKENRDVLIPFLNMKIQQAKSAEIRQHGSSGSLLSCKIWKNYENCKGDDFLNYFELGYGIDFVSEAVGGNLKAVLKKAISQLIKMTLHKPCDLKRRCPYHANVINMLDTARRMIG